VRTYSPKPGDVQRQWHVIDATDVVLGRLATQAATLLRGKHKPIYAPHIDTGDFVVIVNCAKVALTGNKRENKVAYRHSGFPGGLRSTPYSELLDKHPEKAVAWSEHAQEAQGLRRPGTSPRGPGTHILRDRSGRAVARRG
jgi:large subunit ribosomal protein L13